jgi:ParB family chromosome partitioning protein
LTPAEVLAGSPTASAAALLRAIVADGGSVLSVYRDPLGGHWQILAAIPVDRVEPTPFQRDLSETHVKRLTDVIGKMDRFLDPITAVRAGDGRYWTPNGHHRLAAMRALGSKAITALVLPETEAAYRILALNVEKAHNLREKSLEVIRMARALAPTERRSEADLALEFEEAAFLTLGICYEKQGRFSGGAYHPVLRRVDEFLSRPIAAALTIREERAARVLSLDELVAQAVRGLKERGFVSPYLKAYVVARVNPLRFQKTASAPSFDSTLDRMLAAARRFDPSKIRADQLAASSAWTGEGDAS